MNYYGGMAQFCYRTAFISADSAYGIVVYKTFRARARAGQRIPNGALSVAADENVQYLVLALIWLFMPQWPIAMLPYSIYSVFHVATYTRSNLIPTLQTKLVAPPAGTPNAKPVPAPNPIADKIGVFVKTYYDTSMSVVASLEVAVWFRLALSFIFFQRRSWIMITLYTIFLRARYAQSPHIRAAFAQFEARADAFLGAQNIPPAARNYWEMAKSGAGWFHDATDLNKYMGGASAPKKAS